MNGWLNGWESNFRQVISKSKLLLFMNMYLDIVYFKKYYGSFWIKKNR